MASMKMAIYKYIYIHIYIHTHSEQLGNWYIINGILYIMCSGGCRLKTKVSCIFNEGYSSTA